MISMFTFVSAMNQYFIDSLLGQWREHRFKKSRERDFPSGPAVKNPPCHAGYEGSIPGRGTKIPRASEQLSLLATRDSMSSKERSCMMQ